MRCKSIIFGSMFAFASAVQLPLQGRGSTLQQRDQTLAICMSGASRTIVRADVQSGFKKYVRNSIYARGFTNALPDLFIYVRVGDTHDGPANLVYNDKVAVEKAIQALNATAAKVDDGAGPYNETSGIAELVGDTSCFQGGTYMSQPSTVARMMNFYEGWETCHGMIEENEIKSGNEYDLVMHTRPDIIWKKNLDLSWFSHGVAWIAIDWWVIVPRILSKHLADTLQEYFLSRDEHCCNKAKPEQIMFCRASYFCNQHGLTCNLYGRGGVDERLKRGDGSEKVFPFRNVPPGGVQSMNLEYVQVS